MRIPVVLLVAHALEIHTIILSQNLNYVQRSLLLDHREWVEVVVLYPIANVDAPFPEKIDYMVEIFQINYGKSRIRTCIWSEEASVSTYQPLSTKWFNKY